MRHRKKLISVIMLMTVFLSGCTIKGKEVYFSFQTPGTVFSIGSMSCSKKEASVYLANYRNLYGKVGDTDLWDGRFDNEKLEDGLKQAVINHISRIYSLDVYANDNDIELSDKEKEKVKSAAKEYYDSLSEADRKSLKISQRDIRNYYEKYALAAKVYDELMSYVDEEVSEDEARVMDAYVLFTTDRSVTDEVLQKLAEGSSFSDLTALYSEGSKGEISFSRNTYPKEVEEIAFALEDEEVSGVISADDGYYIIECIDKYNEELSEKNKTTIIAQRQNDTFDGIINDQKENETALINTRVWDSLHLDDNSEIETDTFFSVIESRL